MSPSLNLGILAHVDAGKTSLTERLLYDAGELDAVGSVDAGTTRTDSMDVERRRGITVRSAVASYVADDPGGTVVNIVDTPGHPDFIAEVERALAILDGAVLVLSAVEGVQPQTVVIWRALRRLDVPTLLFINKTDRRGADPERVRADIRRRLPGSEETPVLAGSALTGDGVAKLAAAITSELPSSPPNVEAEPAGVVFKIERDDRGKRVFVRMRSGSLAVRDRLQLTGRSRERVTGLQVSTGGGLAPAKRAVGGQIAVLRGLDAARIGDSFGPGQVEVDGFVPPTLQAVVVPATPHERGAVYAALTELAEQDPLIALRTTGDEIAVSLFGEVQKEVIASLLQEWYGLAVTFRETTVVCIERVRGTGQALEQIKVDENPYLGTVGLRIEPAPVGSGIRFELEVERGAMPPAFFAATEEGVRKALEQGRHGWQVTDCVVTMTDSGYWARQSHAHQKFNKAFSSVAGDFRNLGQVVVTAALRQAGTTVCEPVDRIDLEVPTTVLGAVLALLGRLGGVVLTTHPGDGVTRLEGDLPATQIRALTSQLPDLTGGEAVLANRLDHYAPVTTEPPVRRRVGPDPADRRRWFREMPR
ncbi:elongation factor G [Nocardioides speluncae]|uniref:elongation factor G n=1 Tax=Nocardioides speluncae TaxID=2670337 RepID=UPI00198060F4|nr:TetM/TetW/TetO/TetS family tetracycline resistance ribosomal protection protein [Nocardioides speluncae]